MTAESISYFQVDNTMERNNCWQIRRCGCEPGGVNVDRYGVCPAAISGRWDGLNRGQMRGRCCWAVIGSSPQCQQAELYGDKLINCIQCQFLKQVHEEEGRDFVLIPPDFFNDE
jgi:hypothetical protein